MISAGDNVTVDPNAPILPRYRVMAQVGRVARVECVMPNGGVYVRFLNSRSDGYTIPVLVAPQFVTPL